ncbi:MAG: succinylglutamate desuccinylase/aspartoacylase family protein, partial [Bdellovibrionales bacterium]|nr:succinylglutamate desuccinylase/aspartoacylase family protein [Bdellovibrionales bacterium]
MSPKNNSIELYHSPQMKLESGFSPILMMGGVHGDEPEGVALAEGLLRWLTENTTKIRQNWILIPCLNIDGYSANPRTRTNGNGVDLNRNYPASNWSPESKGERYYPGPSPGSEPETQAIVQLMKLTQPKFMIHFHSWEPMIVLTGPPNLKEAHYLSESCGYKIEGNVGYPTPGSLSHYGWVDQKTPIICIEEQEKLKDLSVVWPHFKKGFEDI